MPSRQYDIKKYIGLEKSNKPYRMSFPLSTFYIASLKAHMALGFENQPWRHGHFGQTVEEKWVLPKATFWYALNCVEPLLTWLQNQPGAIGLVSILLIIHVHGHKYTKLAFVHYFDLGFLHPCPPQNTPNSWFSKGSDMPM